MERLEQAWQEKGDYIALMAEELEGLEALWQAKVDLFVLVDKEVMVTSPGNNCRGPLWHAFA